MSEINTPEAISAPTADIAPSQEADSGSSVLSDLTAMYAAEEQAQTANPGEVENLSEKTEGEEPSEESDAETAKEEETDLPEKTGEEESEISEEAEEAEETADFDALEKKPEFPDEEAIKAKFPRNANKDLVAETARYASEAKAGYELKESLGGDAYIPSMQTIATGIKSGDPIKVFEGLGAASDTAFVNTLSCAMDIALVRAKTLAESDDPQIRAYGESAAKLGDTMLAHRFGEGVDSQAIDEFAMRKNQGWFDALNRWIEDGDISYGEFRELLEQNADDPKIQAIAQENKALKTQLEAKTAKSEQEATERAERVESSFDTTISESFEKIYDEVVLKTSVLRINPADTAEMKTEKEILRKVVVDRAKSAFQSGEKRKGLLDKYKTGAGHTATYAESLADAINEAVLTTKSETIAVERIIAKLYNNTRNGALARKKSSQTETTAAQIETAATGETPQIGRAHV